MPVNLDKLTELMAGKAEEIARAAFEAGPPDGWEIANPWDDIDDEMRDSCFAFTRNVLAVVSELPDLLALQAEADRMRGALTRIAEMTDIEADFDGFEARTIARKALEGGAAS